ncbi:MerR family transcriptional regulator [Phycicoccus jejuensis]|uniref:DNA polymerase III subunit beta family protein n=1 Tax=Phycicoccus jejuensis TaxID=367299 RepID=UPI00384C0E10
MENELLGIGKVSALSGLPVSALRFYDGADVLPPALVDPSSGYRYYRPDQVRQARLVAHLRRVGLPLDEIRTVVAEPTHAGPVLAAHLDRLEAGLADARREISIVHDLLKNTETPMYHCTLPATALVQALREVRYAVSHEPTEERLHGVYLDSEAGRVRVVATDRYRLAASAMSACLERPSVGDSLAQRLRFPRRSDRDAPESRRDRRTGRPLRSSRSEVSLRKPCAEVKGRVKSSSAEG